nr:RNA-directed DNA polymerase, eukaryota, reverse transcriptase zinc-binding domain protein [Tanacetum cinerariifolium]
MQKIVTCGIPWVILAGFNVTLKVFEHSNGSANPFSELSEFQDCVNNIEVEDLHSEGFHYTWTKSLKNPKCRSLKKLDRDSKAPGLDGYTSRFYKSAWSIVGTEIQAPNISDENEDEAVWIARDGQEKKFKISNVWKDMVYGDIKIIDEMKVLPSNKNIWSIVRRLVYGAAVYHIWQEKNNRLFRNEKRDSNTIINIAKEAVGMKLLGIKVKESGTVKEVEEDGM